jgi:hypothetical protein
LTHKRLKQHIKISVAPGVEGNIYTKTPYFWQNVYGFDNYFHVCSRVHEKEKELEWLAVNVKSHAVTDVPKKTMNVVNPMP